MSAPVPLNSGCCAPPCPSNPQTAVPGPAGENAFSFTTANFVQPAVNANVTVALTHSGWVVPGQVIFVGGGGYYQVVSVSGLNVVLDNLGNVGNSSSGTTVNAGAEVSPGGTGGSGGNAFTTTSANFTQPAVSSTVNVQVVNSAWAAVGQRAFIATGGYYTVFSVPDATHITVTNNGDPGNAAPAAVINSPQQFSPAGLRGPTGPAGAATLNSISPTTTKGDLIVDNGANNPLASDVRQAVGTNGQLLASDSTQPTGIGWKTVHPNTAATDGDIVIFSGTTGTPMAVKDSKMLVAADGSLQSTPSGGNARGGGAVDLQCNRAANTQVASGAFGVVSGGLDNTASGVDSVVAGGLSNVASATGAVVSGGQANGATATNATACGGGGNAASGVNSTIGGGLNNVANAQGTNVTGGETNTASGIDSTVPGGTNNTASGKNSVACGAYAKADKYGQLAIGSDAETIAGGFQFSVFLPVASTTDATPTPMLLNIAGVNRMVIPTNTLWGFFGIVQGKIIGTPTACSVWSIAGGIKNAGGTVTLVGVPTVTLLGQDAGFPGGSAVAVAADAANVAMKISVTGAVATPIVWGGAIRVCELLQA